jgi:hypothetical protein
MVRECYGKEAAVFAAVRANTCRRRAFQSILLSVAVSLLLPCGLAGCAGYQIGNQSLFPDDIHTVHVPIFASNSFRRNLGERLTEAVAKEIEARTPYKVVNDAGLADSVLTARLVADTKRTLVPSLTGDARDTQVGMHVKVSWVDRKGRALRDDKAVPLPEELTDITTTASVVPEVGQSITTAQQTAINRMATQIVGLMEKPW